MGIFAALLLKLIPLYFVITLGYVAGKFLNVKKESIAPLLIYIIAPIVVFNSASTTKIHIGILILPVIFFSLCSLVSIVFYLSTKKIFADSTRNILAFASGAGNTGYFGLPVVAAIFGKDLFSVAVFATIGVIFFEHTIGYFIVARGNHTVVDSLRKVFRLPAIWVFVIGIIFNLLGINFGSVYGEFITNVKGSYVVLGMMLIGLGLASMKEFKIDLKFLGLSLLSKFVVWPIFMFVVIFLDSILFKILTPDIHKLMIVLSIVPIAANTVALATDLKVHPEKASFAVLVSTLIALLYIPLVVSFCNL